MRDQWAPLASDSNPGRTMLTPPPQRFFCLVKLGVRGLHWEITSKGGFSIKPRDVRHLPPLFRGHSHSIPQGMISDV